jgi:phosphotriesterase-related protein
MDRICIGHSADSTDVAYLEELLKTGVYLSMDRYPGSAGRPNWQQRNATVKALVERGWAERLMLGHDYAPMAVLAGQEPVSSDEPTRYLFLNTVALPALREQGIDEATITTMMRDVPRRFLTGETV